MYEMIHFWLILYLDFYLLDIKLTVVFVVWQETQSLPFTTIIVVSR